jgi:inner membrane protein YhjD
MGVATQLDEHQRRHSSVALPLAVVYKLIDDQGTMLAAMITYYGFVSLFPLLLLLVTCLGFALTDNPGLQQQVLHSALRDFPVLGDQLAENVHSLHGSTAAVVVGIVGSLYGGLGVSMALQNALNKVWAVPRAERPSLVGAYLRGFALLGVLSLGLVLTTSLAALTGAVDSVAGLLVVGIALRLCATAISVAVNAAVLLLIYRVLTFAAVPLRTLWPGAVVAAVLWQLLQVSGAYLVAHQLRGASATYGLFGIVLGLIAWIYLGALILVLGAEINTVWTRRLYPRSLQAPDPAAVELTDADRRAYSAYARTERQKRYQTVRSEFDPPRPAPPVTGNPDADGEAETQV